MKKILFICLTCLIAALPLFAGQKKEVVLRSSRNDNILRVVLESDDNTIRNANIIATLSNIKIEFPDAVELKKQSFFVFETTSTDRTLLIKPKNAEDLSFYKLGGPSRIVIDVKVAQKPAETAQPQPPAVKPAEPKTPQRPAGAPQPQAGEKPTLTPQTPVVKPIVSKVIFLDPGHGGYDYGLIAKDAKEKDLDLLLTKDLSAALAKLGHKVFLSRKVDQSLSIHERISFVNRKPDLFISIHSSASNAFAVCTAAVDESGAESPVNQYGLGVRQSRHVEKSRALAKTLGTSLKTEFKGDVILRELPLPVLSSIDSAAVLIEYPSVQTNAYDQKMRDRIISALIKGIRSHE